MKKKVVMRKKIKRQKMIQLLAKRYDIMQIVEHLDNFSIKDLEVLCEKYQKHGMLRYRGRP